MPGYRHGHIVALADILQTEQDIYEYKKATKYLAYSILIVRLRNDRLLRWHQYISFKPEYNKWHCALQLINRAMFELQDSRPSMPTWHSRHIIYDYHFILVTNMLNDVGLTEGYSTHICRRLLYTYAWEPQIQFIKARLFRARYQLRQIRTALQQTQAAIRFIVDSCHD